MLPNAMSLGLFVEEMHGWIDSRLWPLNQAGKEMVPSTWQDGNADCASPSHILLFTLTRARSTTLRPNCGMLFANKSVSLPSSPSSSSSCSCMVGTGRIS